MFTKQDGRETTTSLYKPEECWWAAAICRGGVWRKKRSEYETEQTLLYISPPLHAPYTKTTVNRRQRSLCYCLVFFPLSFLQITISSHTFFFFFFFVFFYERVFRFVSFPFTFFVQQFLRFLFIFTFVNVGYLLCMCVCVCVCVWRCKFRLVMYKIGSVCQTGWVSLHNCTYVDAEKGHELSSSLCWC